MQHLFITWNRSGRSTAWWSLACAPFEKDGLVVTNLDILIETEKPTEILFTTTVALTIGLKRGSSQEAEPSNRDELRFGTIQMKVYIGVHQPYIFLHIHQSPITEYIYRVLCFLRNIKGPNYTTRAAITISPPPSPGPSSPSPSTPSSKSCPPHSLE